MICWLETFGVAIGIPAVILLCVSMFAWLMSAIPEIVIRTCQVMVLIVFAAGCIMGLLHLHANICALGVRATFGG